VADAQRGRRARRARAVRTEDLARHGITIRKTTWRGGTRYAVRHAGKHLGIVWSDSNASFDVYPGLTSVPVSYYADPPISSHASWPEAAAALARHRGIDVPRESVLLEHPIVRVGSRPQKQSRARATPSNAIREPDLEDYDELAADLGLTQGGLFDLGFGDFEPVAPWRSYDGKVPARVRRTHVIVYLRGGRARVHHVSGAKLTSVQRDHAVRFARYHESQHDTRTGPQEYVFHQDIAYHIVQDEVPFLSPIRRNARGAQHLYR
jgi:hypothetical protein